MRRICIAGFSQPTADWVHYQPDNVELWVMNEAHMMLRPHALKRVTAWFQVHERDWKEERKRELGMKSGITPNTFGRGQYHLDFLRSWKQSPIVTHPFDSPWEDIPNSTPYPLKDIGARYGIDGPYLTCTPAMMVAYLLRQDDIAKETGGDRVGELWLAGIGLKVGKEVIRERPCFEYYMGMVKERGIKIVPPPAGLDILKGPVYSVDEPVMLPTEGIENIMVKNGIPMVMPTVQIAREPVGAGDKSEGG